MVNFSTSNLVVDVKAGAAETKNAPVSLWGGFDSLGFKVWGLRLFPLFRIPKSVANFFLCIASVLLHC